MTYNVTLKGIKERDLLPLDDEFASTYGKADSLTELRELLQTNLHVERTREARTESVNAIVEQLNELATLSIPAPMIEDAVQQRVSRLRSRLQFSGASLEAYLRQSNQTEEQLREDIRPPAERDLRTSMILREIAEREGIEISDSDLDHEIDDITADAPQGEEMRQAYGQNQYLRSALRNDLFDQRLTDRLIEIATEGKGAVINGFIPPEAEATSEENNAAATADDPSGEQESGDDADETSSKDDLNEKELEIPS